MRRFIAAALLAVIAATVFLPGCGSSAKTFPIEDISQTAGHSWTCTYCGTVRTFLEYAPPGGKVSGIIFALPGYGNSAEGFRLTTMLDVSACDRGYSVIYVNGLPNPEEPASDLCWNSGVKINSNDDIGFLNSLAVYMQDKYGLSRQETFAAGFSNGAFMMYRIALDGNDCFAGVASVAGMMCEALWERKGKSPEISLLQINGTNDDVVPMNANGSAAYNPAPAVEDVLSWFVEKMHLDIADEETLSPRADLIKHRSDKRNEQVWQVFIDDGHHFWPEEKLCGFDANTVFLDFCDTLRK